MKAYRLSMFALASVLLLLAVFRLYATFIAPWWQGAWANDLIHYLAAIQRWFDTGSPYDPREVAGAFEYGQTTFLHPPISIVLFAPFLVLPWVLWWVIPLGLFAYCTLAWRPAPWTWPVMAAILVVYPVGAIILNGNTDMWAWTFFAAGLRWGWPAALLAVKPSLAVFGLVGVRSRSWWYSAAIIAICSVPFGSLWVDWIRLLLHSPGSLLYSAGNVFMFAVPVIAWLGGSGAQHRQLVRLRRGVRRALGPDPRLWPWSGRRAQRPHA